MKKILFVAFSLIMVLNLFAQKDTVKYWKVNGNLSINFSEVSFTNWMAGGKNSVSGVSLFDMKALYTKDKINWENTVLLGYGLLKEGKNDLVKSEDKIDLNSKLGYKINSEKLFFTTLLNFKTQFADGYKYPDTQTKISGLLSPAYLVISTGFDYKPSKIFSFYLSPVSGKFTIVTDDVLSGQGAFGVEKGKKLRGEFGSMLQTSLNTPVVKNVELIAKLDLFSNYLKNPQNIDVNLDARLNMKINDFLSANFLINMLYDDDIRIPVDTNDDGHTDYMGRRIQLKQLFGAGLSLKF
jgi:hypothetical protein